MKQTVFIILLFLFLFKGTNAQDNLIDSEVQLSMIDSLRDHFGENKKYPKRFELSILTALSYYPELKDVSIIFRRKHIRTTMSALPNGFFLINADENRRYVINIGTNGAISSLLLPSLSFNARVGVIGHELAHIVDYESMTKAELVRFSLDYVFSLEKRAQIEQRTDKIAISKGLGGNVHFFSDYVFNHASVPRRYLKYKKRIYFTPEDIANLLEEENENN